MDLFDIHGEKIDPPIDPSEVEQDCACGWSGLPHFSTSGPHIKATCPECVRYIKFVKRVLPPEERAYWDERKKYKREK
tara:strand:+ start:2765 stop:2998 length:234 start_codon:yes stop_codon:yes gene_type:complete